MTSALILAAGFGTRLRPLTLELPKPVVPVGDRSLLAHIASELRRSGVTRLVANVHHEHQKIINNINELSLDIQVIVEAEIRGTAGGLAGARELLGPGPVLVWNGDILTRAPVRELARMAAERDAQVLALHPREGDEGNVGVDELGRVVRLRGRVFGREVKSGDYIGVMALGASVMRELPERGCLFGDLALPLLAAGRAVWSLPSHSPFSDLGDVHAYVAANFAWLEERGLPAWSAPDARVSSEVRLERSLIGAGAQISGAGLVSEVIAWPGARLQAPLARAVVLGSGRIVPLDASAEN